MTAKISPFTARDSPQSPLSEHAPEGEVAEKEQQQRDGELLPEILVHVK